MNFKDWLKNDEKFVFIESGIPTISPEQAKEMKLFGPVWHGTTEENRSKINQSGFQIFVGGARSGNVTHGYQIDGYGNTNIPPPVHHLGFGIYFTTNRNQAKQYNWGTTKGLQDFYLYTPRLETINWGSTNTMMKWWREHGYDMPPLSELAGHTETQIETIRVEATKKLTDVLRSQFDAVWYKGKGIKTLLDGDQICIYDTKNIFQIDNNLSQGYDSGEGIIVRPGDRIQIKEIYEVAKVSEIKPFQRNELWIELWDSVLGPSPYQFVVSITSKVKNKIKEIWQPKLFESAMRQKETDLFKSWKEKLETDEAVANHYVKYTVDHALTYRFPSLLTEKVLQPKERIKRPKS